MAMGGAYVALADDEEAIFLNPAGMASNQKYGFHFGEMGVVVSNDIIKSAMEGGSAFKELSGETLNVVVGKDIYGQATFSPSLRMPNLGIALLVDGQAALLAKNKAYPQITIGYQTTNGVQVAYGVALGRSTSFAPLKRGEFRIGIGGKLMYRRGGYHQYAETELFDIKNSLNAKTGNFGRGYGLDLGTQYLYNLDKHASVMAGVAHTEVGDLNFGDGPDHQKGNLSFGFAFKYAFQRMRAILSYEYANMLADHDWRKKNHFGAEVSIPMLSLYGGVNQVYLTYGGAIDLWLIRLMVYTYTEERGNYVFIDPEKRWALQATLKFNL